MIPKTENDLSEAVKSTSGPLRIIGGGTRPYGRPVVGETVSTSKLSKITLYDPGALTLVAQAGTPIATIEKTLKAENQRLAFEPMDHRALLGTKGTPTIGGVVAGNISGPRRIAVSACRDFLLGVRFVDGQGQIIKNGGRVMKNVTGYDLVKLMSGAYGTLGILTEVALKVLPDVNYQATMVLDGLDDATAIIALSQALGSPFEVTGAAHDPTAGKTYLRLEGFENSVRYRVKELTKNLAKFGNPEVLDQKASAKIWTTIRDVTNFAGATGDVWRISVKPSQAAETAAAIGATSVQYDWGGGLIWARTPEGTDVRKFMTATGHATLIRASEETRAAIPSFHPEPAPLATLSQGLRAKFDPRGILNTGLMS